MKKKKDGPSTRNRTSAAIVFFIAVVLDVAGYKAGVIYGFAGLFWIAWLFSQTNWLILETAEAFRKAISPPEREDDK